MQTHHIYHCSHLLDFLPQWYAHVLIKKPKVESQKLKVNHFSLKKVESWKSKIFLKSWKPITKVLFLRLKVECQKLKLYNTAFHLWRESENCLLKYRNLGLLLFPGVTLMNINKNQKLSTKNCCANTCTKFEWFGDSGVPDYWIFTGSYFLWIYFSFQIDFEFHELTKKLSLQSLTWLVGLLPRCYANILKSWKLKVESSNHFLPKKSKVKSQKKSEKLNAKSKSFIFRVKSRKPKAEAV